MNSFAKARKHAGYSQAQVAESLNVTVPTVSHWENGQSKPTASRLVALAELYGCSIDKLLKED